MGGARTSERAGPLLLDAVPGAYRPQVGEVEVLEAFWRPVGKTGEVYRLGGEGCH